MNENFFTKIRISFDRTFRILILIVSVLSILITVTIAITQFTRLKYNFDRIKLHITDDYEKFNDEAKIKILIDKLKMQRDSLVTIFITRNTDSTQSIDKTQKINELRFIQIESNIERQNEITTALRQAINPLNPDEVLTIARLKDGISDINKRITELENNINVRQQYFEDSIKREMASSNNSTTLIIVVLIPLILNFLYTLWKDFRKPDKEKNKT